MNMDTLFATPNFTSTGSQYIGQKFTPRITPFGWYGGKYHHLDFLRPLFPLDATTFCDAFGGSGAVILNVGNYPTKIYNDIDPRVVNFFRVLKNPEMLKTLIREITLTPYSREELYNAQDDVDSTKIERARRFYIRAQQARNSMQTHVTWWSHGLLKHLRNVNRWNIAAHKLENIAQRFQSIQIKHATALEIIEKYDSPKTLFYLDPPYVLSTRNKVHRNVYNNEMTDQDHTHLSEVLQTLQGRAVLSGYRSGLYDRLYKNWNRVDAPPKIAYSSRTRSMRQECVWKNF